MLQRNSDLPYVIDEPPNRPAEGWQYPSVDLREMARILRRRYRLLVAPPAILLGLALAYLLFATTLYTATSTVLVDPRRANVVEGNQSVLTNFGTDDATIAVSEQLARPTAASAINARTTNERRCARIALDTSTGRRCKGRGAFHQTASPRDADTEHAPAVVV